MVHRYSTALSHVFLAGIGVYCLRNRVEQGLPLQLLSAFAYGIIILNSILGIWKWGNPLHGRKIEKPYYFSRQLQTFFVLPCIVGQLWLSHTKTPHLAYLHPSFSLLMLTTLFYKRTGNEKNTDFLLLINIASCALVSLTYSNWFGVASAIAYTINWFIMRDDDFLQMPGIDFYNYALCFFSYFSVKALQGV